MSNTEGSIPGNGHSVRIPNTGSSGVWLTTVTVHGLFTVSSGNEIIYLLAEEEFGSWAVTDRRLSLVYLPSSYEIRDGEALAPPVTTQHNRLPGQ